MLITIDAVIIVLWFAGGEWGHVVPGYHFDAEILDNET